MAQKLNQHGIAVDKVIAVADKKEAIVSTLEESFKNSKNIISEYK